MAMATVVAMVTMVHGLLNASASPLSVLGRGLGSVPSSRPLLPPASRSNLTTTGHSSRSRVGQEKFALFQGQPAVGLTTSTGSPEPEAEALWRFARKVWGLSVCYTQGQQGELTLQTPPEHKESTGKITDAGKGTCRGLRPCCFSPLSQDLNKNRKPTKREYTKRPLVECVLDW